MIHSNTSAASNLHSQRIIRKRVLMSHLCSRALFVDDVKDFCQPLYRKINVPLHSLQWDFYIIIQHCRQVNHYGVIWIHLGEKQTTGEPLLGRLDTSFASMQILMYPLVQITNCIALSTWK